ncbi:MAG TPA: hypothetical protein VHP83_03975 [Aggregatilineaceae bacterium]|nr:hypothetical protein [Aggregatilineaceae bacterium]
MPFEVQALPINGTITATVLDPNGQVPERTIIQIPDDWAINVRWSVAGNMVALFSPTAQWHVKVSLESLGPGMDLKVVDVTEAMGAPAFAHNYDRTMNIPGNYPGLAAGAYKLVTVLTLENAGTPAPIAGYVEGPVLQFYQFP